MKNNSTPFSRGYDIDQATKHLRKRDPELAKWIKKIGAIETAWHKPFDPVDRLARAILYQQLSGKAAETIMGRLLIALDGGKKIKADRILQLPEAKARACGVSANKWLALTDLAHKAFDGVVPSVRDMANLGNDELITRLTSVRGIGRWTVEMLLIFPLGRPDVLPIDDLGIRRGAQVLREHSEMMKPKALAEHGEIWAPYRSMASLYLWRIADFAKPAQSISESKKHPKKPAPKTSKSAAKKTVQSSKSETRKASASKTNPSKKAQSPRPKPVKRSQD